MKDYDFNAAAIEQAAIQRDGLSDFGPPDHREPLERLLWSLKNEANLNEIGSLTLQQRLFDILSTRLRVQDYLKRFPEILQEKIEAPLVIVGLPRTGTTMLHRTIAADHRMLAPLWYEVRRPCPEREWDFKIDTDVRVQQARDEVDGMLAASPDLISIHPMDPVGADEDIMLLEQSFYSFMAQACANVPSFDRWLDEQDHTPGYEYLRTLLQFLQWQKRRSGQSGSRWVLKAPHHIHFLDLVLKVFPDAKIVQSHRDPVETIPSFASLVAGVWKIYTDTVDQEEVGRLWAGKFARGMERSMQIREAFGEEQFLDLWYRDTIDHPLIEVEKIYAFMGLQLTSEAQAEMERWQEFNRRELRPSHDYSLEQYGFTEEGLAHQFNGYRQKYILG